MRVISGTAGGLRLKAVPGTQTRPTTDKVKEAIFNRIGPYFDGGSGLDLFAGSGGLGIEALSRGMEECIFVDAQQQAIQTIRANLRHTKLESTATIYRNDSIRAIKTLVKRDLRMTFIFIDPPYAQAERVMKALLPLISEGNLLTHDGIIVCETAKSTFMPESHDDLQKSHEQAYGDTKITLYERGT